MAGINTNNDQTPQLVWVIEPDGQLRLDYAPAPAPAVPNPSPASYNLWAVEQNGYREKSKDYMAEQARLALLAAQNAGNTNPSKGGNPLQGAYYAQQQQQHGYGASSNNNNSISTARRGDLALGSDQDGGYGIKGPKEGGRPPKGKRSRKDR